MVRVAEQASGDRHVGVRVERTADCDVALDSGRQEAVFRASANFKLVLALEILEGHLVGDRCQRRGEEIGLAGGGTGHHLAALREADDKVIDVEALVVVVLATLGAREIAGPAGDAVDLVDQIAVGISLTGIERAGRAEIDPQPQICLSCEPAQVNAGLPPRAVAVERLHVLVREERGVGGGGKRCREFRIGRVGLRFRGIVRGQQLPGDTTVL